MTALIYWVMVIPAWYARGHIGGIRGRLFFITLLASVIVAANLRLHLWFTSRFYELGADVGARSFEPLDQGRRLGVRGGAHRGRSADPRRRLAPVDRAAIGGGLERSSHSC